MLISFILPPQWTPLNPFFSIASLVGQLRGNNYKVNVHDINIEFYNHILTKEYLVNAADKAFKMHETLFQDIRAEYTDDKKAEEYSKETQIKLLRYSKIKEFKEQRYNDIQNIPDKIEEAVATVKCKERFYQPELLIRALDTIDIGLEIASLPYFPSRLELHDYSTHFFRLTYESIKECCLDRSTNMFYEYYEKILPSIIEETPDMIGISINSSSQIIPGLTLAMLLKQKTNKHINIGGNFFGRVTESLENTPEFFELFADSVVVEEGEKPMVELAKFIEGKLPIEQVPNIVYFDGEKVKINEKIKPLVLNEMCYQDLEGFPFEKYFTPEIVLSVLSSRGCYWKKCTFCDHDFGQNYCIKNLDKLIEELKLMQDKFGISHFEFIDEAISPSYLKQMSERVIKEGLEISWFNNARTESEFTKDILHLASEAGLKMMLWGVESGSERIMELINKGVDFNQRMEVLKDSSDYNIWNFAFVFLGFPSETREDALKTIEMICKNTDIISSYGRSVFALGKHTKLSENPEKFSITEIYHNDEEFSPSYEFKVSKGMNSQELQEMANVCIKECNKAYENPLWMYLRYREYIFLYVAKYGAKEVQDCKIV